MKTFDSSEAVDDLVVYEVPLSDISLDDVVELTQSTWFHALVNDPVTTWKERLSVDDGGGETESILSSALSTYEPASIVFCKGYLGCGIIPVGCAIKHPALLYIGPRHDIAERAKFLNAHEFNHARELAGLSGMLEGFRQLHYPLDGQMRGCNDDDIVTGDNFEFECGIRPPATWDPVMRVFTCLNGDSLFVNQSGMSGWVQLETHQAILRFCDSITDLAHVFSNYLKKVGDDFRKNAPDRWIMPFDSYSCLDYLTK